MKATIYEYYFFDIEGRLLPINPTEDILERGSVEMDLFDRECPYPMDVNHRLRVLHSALTTKRMKWGR